MLRTNFDASPASPASAASSRRTGSGYAAATQPVTAMAIRTDAAGLVAGAVTLPAGDFALPVYRAMPEGSGPFPVVLVLSEIFGVHEYVADVARRFARLGYLAIAPELFVRQGDAKAEVDIPTLYANVISKVPDAQVMADLDACVAWAASHGGDVARLGVTGFCWGGRATWLYLAHNPDVKAGVAWYGRLVGTTDPLHPAQPVDIAARLHAPVLGLYGGADTGIALESVEQMKAALAKGNESAKASQFVVYQNAGHAFHADYRPSYDEASARDGWERCVRWLRQHGVG